MKRRRVGGQDIIAWIWRRLGREEKARYLLTQGMLATTFGIVDPGRPGGRLNRISEIGERSTAAVFV